jgi:hypothetical protein
VTVHIHKAVFRIRKRDSKTRIPALGLRIRIQAGQNGAPKGKKKRDFIIEGLFGGLEASPGAWKFFLEIQ